MGPFLNALALDVGLLSNGSMSERKCCCKLPLLVAQLSSSNNIDVAQKEGTHAAADVWGLSDNLMPNVQVSAPGQVHEAKVAP